jgi:Zn-finger nucleic acid-binding protein
MARRNFKDRSGVIVDVCAAHGVWLDRGELDALLRFASSGALAKAERDNTERDAGRARVDQWARDLRGVGPRHYVYVGRHMAVGPSVEDLTELIQAIPGLGPSKD